MRKPKFKKALCIPLLAMLWGLPCQALQSGVTSLSVQDETVTAPQADQKIVERRIESLDVYALSKSAFKLRFGHMLSAPLYQRVQKEGIKDDIRAAIKEAAAKHGLQWELIAALIMTESGFNPQARSGKGAAGLMQLMPATASDLGVSDLYDPRENIDAGCRYLKRQLQDFSDLNLALAAYNAGPGAVRQHRGVPPFEETQNFVQRVLSFYRGYQDLGSL